MYGGVRLHVGHDHSHGGDIGGEESTGFMHRWVEPAAPLLRFLVLSIGLTAVFWSSALPMLDAEWIRLGMIFFWILLV